MSTGRNLKINDGQSLNWESIQELRRTAEALKVKKSRDKQLKEVEKLEQQFSLYMETKKESNKTIAHVTNSILHHSKDELGIQGAIDASIRLEEKTIYFKQYTPKEPKKGFFSSWCCCFPFGNKGKNEEQEKLTAEYPAAVVRQNTK